jgi:hypothetical protein
VEDLTARAERALLGAMITDPALTGRLRISPHEFASQRHAAVYASIRQARHARLPGAERWREAILDAGQSLTGADLDALVRACPFAAHGPAYAVMVIQAWAQRHLDQSAHVLAVQSGLLDMDSRQVMASGQLAGQEMAATAGHLRKVAFAIHQHAREVSPQMPGPQGRRRYGASPDRVRREEAVLAGLLQQDPERNAGILRTLPAEAFTNPHRKEIYQVASAMYRAGKAVDELTLDWELAVQGVPLDARQSYGATRDDHTYAMYLARLDCGYQEPAVAAGELAAEYEEARVAHPAGSARPRAAGGRQAGRRRGDPSADTIPGRPVLRLVQPPPEAGPSERGPQQGR